MMKSKKGFPTIHGSNEIFSFKIQEGEKGKENKYNLSFIFK